VIKDILLSISKVILNLIKANTVVFFATPATNEEFKKAIIAQYVNTIYVWIALQIGYETWIDQRIASWKN
jgi:hypothetical protein